MSNSNYTKIPDSLLQNKQLNLSSRVIYARLVYRMNLSIMHNKQFYDSKKHFYYVVYQIKDLMHDCGLGRTTVINALKELSKHSYIIKHRFIHSMRLELPRYEHHTSKSQKIVLVREQRHQNKNISDSNSDRRLKRVKNRWQNNNIKKYDDKLDHQNMVKAIRYQHLPKPLIEHIHKLLNGKTLYKCIHVLLQAKASIIKDYHGSKLVKLATDFDINEYYTYNNSRDFINYIDHGLRKAWHNAHKIWNYFMIVCKHYYSYALKWFNQNRAINVPNNDGPCIPIFKI